MDTYYRLEDLPPVSNSALTLGTFDGLHRGHLAVIERLMEVSRERKVPAVVLTFDPYPQHILAPPSMPKKELIITLDKKLALLEKAGVDLSLVLKFDLQFSRITARDFLEKIVVDQFHPSHIVVGYDHHFGYQRQGDARFLQEHASTFGYEVDLVEVVTSSGSTISSSNIRQLLREGRCEEAEQLLGRLYEIPGRITPGIGRGQELDYPTANLTPDEPNQLIPKGGVYIVSADINRRTTFGMCNVGYRPTFDGRALTIEAHFVNPPEENLYDLRVTFRFHHRIRDEYKFDSREELRVQLNQDKQITLKWIAEYQGGKQIHASVS
ncbi:MAG: bifunctional riboflavin kinase/FAD synthetase [Candidatus Neomarinimicrobiota bacterium]